MNIANPFTLVQNSRRPQEKKECLKERREFFVEGTDRNSTRIRNFLLENQLNNEWLTVDKIQSNPSHVKKQDIASNPETEEQRQCTFKKLSLNVRRLRDSLRKTFFANAIAHSSFDILCIAESRLTIDVPNKALCLHGYQIYQNEREATKKQRTPHRCCSK